MRIAIALAIGCLCVLAQSRAEDRPNIVFILTDDHRADALTSSGNEQIHTPNFDSIAARGATFRNAFVTLSVCSPSRAACLTGRYGSANGVTSVGRVRLNKDETTFANLLRVSGYRTGVTGKWHLATTPEACGFDFASVCYGNGTWYDRKFKVEGKSRTMQGFVDDVVADESIRFVRESVKRDKPFMLWMCTQVPHMDHRYTWPARQAQLDKVDLAQMPLPESWQDDLSQKPPYLKVGRNRTQALKYGYDKSAAIRKHARDYYASVSQVDASVGRVLAELNRLKLRENTWIILMGDNGWLLGEHGMTSKVLPYENSIRVPMAIAGPSTKSQTVDELVLNIDLTATILELAGLETPDSLHGRSLLPFVQGTPPDDWRSSFLYEAPTPQLGSRPLWAVRTQQWKYIETHVAPGEVFRELYNLNSDAGERKNLAKQAEHKDTVAKLSQQLREHKTALKETDQANESQPQRTQDSAARSTAKQKARIAGVYPHLTMYNSGGECGTGAVVPWADRLWVITYSPHSPNGSSDKLYEITPDLNQIIRPESVGGTPANRMIHRESNQLNIGPYLIDAERNVRVLHPKKMLGRLTGTARHLTDLENKIYVATMEEGLYSVDVKTLAVTEHIADGHAKKTGTDSVRSKLPGYHGKGLYSGQGLLVYANNGEHGSKAKTVPNIASGALASWQGSGDWQLIRRNQFTEVTGPGGIYGNDDPQVDPIWSLGWDYRSLILMMLDGGQWHTYRLPKGSHSYDGAHGWNTEWPRIREIGEKDLLATMHGTFWRFPHTFSASNSAGIAPRSNYLKVIGDFA
ncbi:MAG: sulfatase-like hydrolase/transferase, partial [Pirellulales bacterium]|nr:sulfatase-like hydrolase/transferase [Pirellulales bacterium]